MQTLVIFMPLLHLTLDDLICFTVGVSFGLCVIGVGIVYFIIIFDVRNHVNNFFEFHTMWLR